MSPGINQKAINTGIMTSQNRLTESRIRNLKLADLSQKTPASTNGEIAMNSTIRRKASQANFPQSECNKNSFKSLMMKTLGSRTGHGEKSSMAKVHQIMAGGYS